MRFVACHGLCGWQGFRKSKDVWWMLTFHCYLSQSLCSSTPVSASVAYMYTVYIFGFFLSQCQFPKINVNLCNSVIPHWFSNPFVMYKICSLWPKLSHKVGHIYLLVHCTCITICFRETLTWFFWICVWFEKVLLLLLQMNAKR